MAYSMYKGMFRDDLCHLPRRSMLHHTCCATNVPNENQTYPMLLERLVCITPTLQRGVKRVEKLSLFDNLILSFVSSDLLIRTHQHFHHSNFQSFFFLLLNLVNNFAIFFAQSVLHQKRDFQSSNLLSHFGDLFLGGLPEVS